MMEKALVQYCRTYLKSSKSLSRCLLSTSGFHLPDTVKGRSRTGTVVAVGPGRINLETGEHLPLAVNAGDRVVLKEFDGYRFDWEGETYFVFTENEIIGKLKE